MLVVYICQQMASPRLLFLYPRFFGSIRMSEEQVVPSPLRPKQTLFSCRAFQFKSHNQDSAFVQRYGPANESRSPPTEPINLDTAQQATTEGKTKKGNVQGGIEYRDISTDKPQKNPANTAAPLPFERTNGQEALDDSKLQVSKSQKRELDPEGKASKSLDTVLLMEPPTVGIPEEQRHSMHAPPYVHNFDTYSLVKDLGKGGFTQDQAITLMKAVRSQLAINLDIARQNLVSRSDVENVQSHVH